ncbi:DUF58 domain-containing protein [Geodermatophilus sp. YIM 151500]|uniref:DUF58 domain-containing protein n=1 Tax=Geodermatophilus sp. YIM 151500 TaxID=2984531 RepID=UPI0021E4C21A|nr:DUF58 domain-containing protein [Geodermatophilus sp. YIM 151500]MCV2491391.1 DUF58 domain-containing protein [Geodermatophilus sp. YIM 151500]
MRGGLRAALGSLTRRGRAVAAGGGTLLLLGALLGERSLVQLAVFVLALPLLSVLSVGRQRFRLSSRRTATPSRVERGAPADVLLEVTNTDRHPGGLWLLSEQLPADLGPAPRFVVERLGSRSSAPLHYRVRGARRGRHLLGPLRLRLVDPFGLVERTVTGTGTTPLLVLPRVRPLRGAGPAGGHGEGADGSRKAVAVHGEDDVSLRPYRHGDDLRKVHWRATARTGELMVRLEERPWRSQATLLLDTRARAHLLAGRRDGAVPVSPRGDPSPPPDSLEWLVEAAASIGTLLGRRGSVLRVVTDTGELRPASGRGSLGPDELLEQLALVRPSRATGLGPAVEELDRVAGEGPVVCLLGAVGPDDVDPLLRARTGPATDVAVLADIGSWAEAGRGGPGAGRRGLSGAARAELDRQREECAALLRAAGWRVATARADLPVERVWTELVRGVGLPAGGPGVEVPA